MRKLYLYLALFILVVAGLLSPNGFAADKKLRGEIFCFPAKNIPRLLDRIANIKDSRRDVVDVNLDPRFLIKDGGAWPEIFYLGFDEEVITPIPFSREDGRTPSFIEAVRKRPDTDICVKDKARADRPYYDEGLYFEMGLSPFFKNRSGRHSMAELEEGTKDGRIFYKRMIPRAVSFLMPDTKHLAIKYEDPQTPLSVQAKIGEERLPIPSEPYEDFHIISLKSLQKIQATELIIQGGPYHLQPLPSPDILRRFDWRPKEEDDTQ